MATSLFSTPYEGTERRLIISLDVGTTFSGASYMILTPGQVPERFSVTGFKGQEDLVNSSKVPTVLLYDDDSNLMKCGAEAIEEYDKDGFGIEVEWFKLLLAPQTLFETSLRSRPRVNIPDGLTVVDVLGDYLKFLVDCVRDAVIQSQPEGERTWLLLAPEAHYVLSHPNGWEGSQQNTMRQAAIRGSLIPHQAAEGYRIHFVTEGEASFHWCMSSQVARNTLKVGDDVVIVDAGGGTIDISSFVVTSLEPLQVKEAHAPICELAGSVFVTQTFARQIQDHLKYSDYGDEETIDQIVNVFDRKTKCLFRDPNSPAFIKFGSRRDNDAEYGVKNGVLTVPGDIMANSFLASHSAITSAVRKVLKSKASGSHVFLVGGFAASPFLYDKMCAELRDLGIEVNRNDSHTSKAVAEGGLSFYLEHYVTERIAKYTIGIKVEKEFSWRNVSHLWRGLWYGRQTNTINDAKYLSKGFLALVTKGDVIARGEEVERPVYLTVSNAKDISVRQKIIKYTGPKGTIQFLDQDKTDFFKLLCTFTAGPIPSTAMKEVVTTRGRYYEFHGKFVVALGGTEVQCRLEWDESGERRRSLATPVWIDNEEAGEEEREEEAEVEEEAVVRLQS